MQSLPLFPTSDQQTRPPHPLAARTILPITYPFASSQSELRTLIHSMTSRAPYVFMPDFGIFAVTYRSFKWEDRKTAFIHFWSAQAADGILNIGQCHPCELGDPTVGMAVSVSGTYVLVLVHKGENRPGDEAYSGDRGSYLGLLHFTSTPTPHSTFRKLEIENISSLSCTQIALDDTLGLVLALDDVGNMTAIWYT